MSCEPPWSLRSKMSDSGVDDNVAQTCSNSHVNDCWSDSQLHPSTVMSYIVSISNYTHKIQERIVGISNYTHKGQGRQINVALQCGVARTFSYYNPKIGKACSFARTKSYISAMSCSNRMWPRHPNLTIPVELQLESNVKNAISQSNVTENNYQNKWLLIWFSQCGNEFVNLKLNVRILKL